MDKYKDKYKDKDKETQMQTEPDFKFDDQGLIPAIIQQYDTKEVLMLAWMDAEAIRRTRQSDTTWFWSRSRQEYWNKGATSGNFQQVKSLSIDCDRDCLLVEVDSPGPACHTGNRSCFYTPLGTDPGASSEVGNG
ncbi:MAG: phosphoribosyl-AMP cyclohydrolase [Coriobacteriales bacterium]|jgi:phosphoribosyl-AMP cyclohydrolase|nr:phosphoribosyl-AMP cyclohydrolase [Coriobacteriales bacterium]